MMLKSIRKGMGALKVRPKYAPLAVLAVPTLPTEFWDMLMKLFAIIVAWLQQVLASLFG
ncbi:hypothetical protein KEJ51_07870 [Candidatus Bathyarchaeota archaeon]|nr:hypothetical protein [Candidatus Bathyarchaeota archaeon]MBS7629589.1 hypothetical protein [Candidatus Bathyarchaeota archaeon]